MDFIYPKVAVIIKDGRIESIDLLEHKNEHDVSAEVLTEKIVVAQSLEVDAISGSTNSSKVIKKAAAAITNYPHFTYKCRTRNFKVVKKH